MPSDGGARTELGRRQQEEDLPDANLHACHRGSFLLPLPAGGHCHRADIIHGDAVLHEVDIE